MGKGFFLQPFLISIPINGRIKGKIDVVSMPT